MKPWREHKAASLAAIEKAYWSELWEVAQGNLSEVARLAGTQRGHVRGYVKRHALKEPATPAAELPPAKPRKRGAKK